MSEQHRVDLVAVDNRVVVEFNGETLADSTEAVRVDETGYPAVYYLPRHAVRMDLLHPSDHHTHCPYKGDASYFSIDVDGKQAENAVWYYEEPIAAVHGLKGLVAFYPEKIDGITVDGEKL
jgi:uncharacterized protein (DUF427 family)